MPFSFSDPWCTLSEIQPFEIWTFWKSVFKWSGFGISDPIWNPDQLQSILFWPFKIQTSPDFRSPLYYILILTHFCWLSKLSRVLLLLTICCRRQLVVSSEFILDFFDDFIQLPILKFQIRKDLLDAITRGTIFWPNQHDRKMCTWPK